MSKVLLAVIFIFAMNISWAEKSAWKITKNTSIAKGKQVAVMKDKKDKNAYYSKVERALMVAGYSVISDKTNNAKDTAYYIEYHIGTVPKRGKNDFEVQMSLMEQGSGKVIAIGEYIGHNKGAILTNLDPIISEFIAKVGQ